MAINESTFAGTDLDQAMQNAARLHIDRAPTLSAFFDRSQEARLRSNDNVIIDNYHFDVDGTKASSIVWKERSDYKANYAQTTEFSLSQQSFKIDQGGENGFRMYARDVEKSSRGRQRIADGSQNMRNIAVTEREDDIVSYMDSLATYTTDEPAAADVPLLDNTGKNGNAGAIYHKTIGVAANVVDNVTGAITGNEAAKLATATALVEALADLRLRIRRRNVGISESGRVIGMDPGTFAFVCPPEVGRAFNSALRLLKLPNEELNRQLYRDLGAFADAAFEFQLDNLASFSSTSLPTPSSATDGFDCYLMTNKAIFYGEQAAQFWSQTPRSMGGVNNGPYYSYHQLFEWGRKMVNQECIIKVTVRSA